MLKGKQLEQAKNQYTALHEGLPPRGTTIETIAPFAKKKFHFGRMSEIQYEKIVPDGDHPYNHPFARRAMPTVFIDAKGRIGIYRGRYVVTSRGIEDRSYAEIENETLPKRAHRLITLGKIEFFRYIWEDEDGNEHQDEISFSPRTAPTISHDEFGDLHVTGGRTNTEAIMKKARNGSKKARRNPSGGMDFNSRAKRTLEYGFVVGLGSTAVAIGMAEILARTSLSVRNGALLQLVAGPALGLAAAYAAPSMPSLAASLTLGNVIPGFTKLYALYVAPRLRGMMPGNTRDRSTTGTPGITPGTTPGQTPGGYPSLPAGRVPVGYVQFQGQGCGIPG